jgi:hypothetical protein
MVAAASCSLSYVEYFGRQKNILSTCTNKSTRNAQKVLTLSPMVTSTYFRRQIFSICPFLQYLRKVDRKETVSNIKELARTGAYNVKKKVIQQTQK